MIKVFTTNKNGKIEMTIKELKELLDESYWEGYKNNSTYVYKSPLYSPYYVSTTAGGGGTISLNSTGTNTTIDTSSITIKNDNATTGTISIDGATIKGN